MILAYYKSLFNSTDSNIQFHNCCPPNPNYKLIFKRKITFLGAFCEDDVPAVGGVPSASLPQVLMPLDSGVSKIAFTAWQRTVSSLIHTLPSLSSCGTEQNEPQSWMMTCVEVQGARTHRVVLSLWVLQSTGAAAVQLTGQSSAWLQFCLRGPYASLGLVCVLNRERGYWTGH